MTGPESMAGFVFAGLGGCYAVARLWRVARSIIGGVR